MALRTKTIEYSFALATASVASATARDFTQLAALAIPESTSRTFRSVILECSGVDNGAAASSITAVLMGIALGAVARNDATVTVTMNNSGENQGFLFYRDVTSYFVTNYTGTTMTADCRLTMTGPVTQNCTAKLIITYEFDDSGQTTRIKTVKIPMDGNTGDLTTIYANLGGVASQIPNLSTFLPEASVVFRDIFFQCDIHTGTTAAAAAQLDISYDGAATTTADLSWAHSLNSDTSYRRIDKLQGILSTSATGTIQARATGTATGEPCPCLNGYLAVTYEYDHDASSTILNSLQIPLGKERGNVGGTVTGDKSRYKTEITIQEPTTITLVQSGVLMRFNCSGSNTMDIRCGAQGARTFTHAASAHCGDMSSMIRIDSGGASGAGITLARGFNTLTLDMFESSSTAGNLASNASALLFLNYTSGKDTNGADVHNHTTVWLNRPHATTAPTPRLQSATAITPVIPEASYYLTNVGYLIHLQTGGTTNPGATAFLGEVQGAEAEGAGWEPFFSGNFVSDSEIGYNHVWADATASFLRYPTDPYTGTRLAIETARDYRFDATVGSAGDGCFWQAHMLVTYHAITWAIAGTVTGSGGGTVTLTANRTDTGEKVAGTTRVGEGAYSLTWYDNTVNVVVSGTEDAAHAGASAAGVAA